MRSYCKDRSCKLGDFSRGHCLPRSDENGAAAADYGGPANMVKRIGFAITFLLPVLAQGQWTAGPTAPPTISDPSNLTAAYEALMGQWFAALSPYAFDLFAALAALEIAVFGWNLWLNYHGDIRNAMLATTNKILVIGFFLALLMNAGSWMGAVIDMFVSLGKNASGIPGLGPSVL
jgi:hypothetical protein